MNTTLNVYINNKFYCELVVDATIKEGKVLYDPRAAIDKVMADRDANLLGLFVRPDGPMVIRVEKQE